MKLNFLEALEEQFEMHKDIFYANKMEQLMAYNHPFIGITNHLRLRILKYLYPDYEKEIKDNLIETVHSLFEKNEREYHYIALDLLKKNISSLYKIDYFFYIKDLITEKANWDTVDIIAKDILGKYLSHFPELKQTMIHLLINSENIWKIRSAILFQIHYKEKTNKNLLFLICDKFIDTNNILIHNAIVWALREYSTYNPDVVAQYIASKNFLLLQKRTKNNEFDTINKLMFDIKKQKEVSI